MYSAAGTYPVKLTVTNSGGNSDTTQEVIVFDTTAIAEFPPMTLPAALLVGMLCAVLFIQRTKEN